MSSIRDCPLCDSQNNTLVFTAKNLPIFQNIVYSSQAQAKSAASGNIMLVMCDGCGFVFNSIFDPNDLQFNKHYENEQGHSSYYRNYLSSIIELFKQYSFENKKVIEIGCGKGFFLEQLAQSGFEVAGFDPAYEGDNPNIVKDYFDHRYSNLSANVIVLRHILAHLQNPLEFLHTIGEAVNYNAKVYIEVASLDGILKQGAFWDIYYEHCNYFTSTTLGGMFNKSQQGVLFGGQCQYLIADFKDLRKKNQNIINNQVYQRQFLELNQHINRCREILTLKKNIVLWGASGKGVSFANLVDSNIELISCLVDINPKKQQHYIGQTAHKIISPAELKDWKVRDILVMNDNYLNEIKEMIMPLGMNALTIDTL